jgi:hypothetical protein
MPWRDSADSRTHLSLLTHHLCDGSPALDYLWSSLSHLLLTRRELSGKSKLVPVQTNELLSSAKQKNAM